MSKKIALSIILILIAALLLGLQNALEPRVGQIELTLQAHETRLKHLEDRALFIPDTPTIEYNLPTPVPTPAFGTCGIISALNGLNVRANPSVSATKLGFLPYGAKVIFQELDRTANDYIWGEIVYNNQEAYIAIADRNGYPFLRRCNG